MTFTILQKEKTPFLAIKTTSSECRKIEVFPWFWYKYGHFSNLLFKAILVRKMTFAIIQNEKAPLQAIKTRSSRIRKIDIFPKGLTHGFGPNRTIFPIFFYGNIGQKNDFYDNLERKNDFLGSKNKKFKMSKN